MSDAKIEEARERFTQSATQRIHEEIDGLLAECQSPIEEILAWELCSAIIQTASELYAETDLLVEVKNGRIADRSAKKIIGFDPGRFYVYPQARVGKYVADFAVEFEFGAGEDYRLLLVECDGHDFHEKTKAQVARDKRRDRFFTSQRLEFFRFSGSEIWRDGPSCARQIVTHLNPYTEGSFQIWDEEASRG